jgi:hypothetical protein
MFAAGWHHWGDELIWVGLVLAGLETLRRFVRFVAGKVHKVIDWFTDKREEDQATARTIEEMQAFVTKNNGGTSLLDQVQSINRKLDNHGERLVLIEDYITNPPTKGHPYS